MIHGWAIGEYITLLNLVTFVNDWVLGNVCIFIGTLELGQFKMLQFALGLQSDMVRLL